MIRAYPRVVLAAALTAIACYLAAAGRAGLIAAVLPAGLAAWMLRSSRAAAHVPRLAVNLGVLAAFAYTGAVVLGRGVRVEDVSELVVWLLILKFFDRSSSRDDAQILGLSTFLVIGAALTSVSFEMGVLLLAFLPLVVLGAMLHQVYAGHEAMTLAARRGAPPGAPARARAGCGPGAGAALARLALASGVGIAALAAATFVLIPRGIGPDWMGRWNKASAGARTRFTENVQLGRAGFISQSPRVVLYLQVFDRGGVPLGGPSAVYHLRGNVLDHYDPGSGMWSRSPDKQGHEKRSETWSADRPVMLGQQVDTTTLEQRVTLLNASGDSAFVFTVQRPVSVQFDRPVRVAWNAQDRRLKLEGESGQVQYRVQSVLVDNPAVVGVPPGLRRVEPPEGEDAPPGEDGAGPLPPPGEDLPAGPPGAPRPEASPAVRELAERVAREAGVDLRLINRAHAANAGAARAIERYLRDGFSYTTQIESPPSAPESGRRTDPVEWFLLEHRRGHCAYFASAMAVMCQSLGIPARVIAGYVAAEWNPAGGHYVVRESNAHAWVEVEQSQNAWATFDPTPPADLDRLHRPAGGLLSRARRLLDAVEHAWISSIVTFDQGARQRLVDRADPGGLDVVRQVQRVTARVRSGGWSLALRAAAAGVGAALGAWLALGLLAALAARARRARGPRRAAARAAAEQHSRPWLAHTGFYTELLGALEARGLPKPPWRPPVEHAAAIGSAEPVVAGAVERLARLYYAARFGGRPLTDAERLEIAPALRAVRDVRGGAAGPAGGSPGRRDALGGLHGA